VTLLFTDALAPQDQINELTEINMEHYLKKDSKKGKVIDFLLFNLVIPITFFFGIQVIFPFDQIFQTGDEGMELIKTDLYREGYQLYKQIWNDQPPLPTILWTFWLNHTGRSVASGRVLTLLFSTVLIWSFCQTVRITVGKSYAILGTLWLILSNYFIRLSSSVMMGLPSLSLVTLSVYLVILYSKVSNIFLLITSAAAYGVSLQIKSFTAFLMPAFIFYLCNTEYSKNQSIKQIVFKIIIWVISFSVVFAVITLALPFPDLTQTVGGHFNSSLSKTYGWAEQLPDFCGTFLHDPDLWIMCVISIWALPLRRAKFPLFPTSWLLLALLTLFVHRPLWYHYYVLVSIPLTWISTFAFKEIFLATRNRYNIPHYKNDWQKKTKILFIFLIIGILSVPVKIVIAQIEIHDLLRKSVDFQQAIPHIESYRQKTKWLFTDIPAYGFMTGIKVPPEIAVFSSKRIESGNLTISQMEKVINRYKPEQVVLGRFEEVYQSLKQTLDQGYDLKYMNKKIRLYLRKSLSA
jgi:hypothetical protein